MRSQIKNGNHIIIITDRISSEIAKAQAYLEEKSESDAYITDLLLDLVEEEQWRFWTVEERKAHAKYGEFVNEEEYDDDEIDEHIISIIWNETKNYVEYLNED